MISIVFLSNLHSTEALRLLESVQLILQPAKVAQPLFWGGNFNLPKCWLAQPLFRGCNFNLPKCGQMHSHSSEVFLGCNYNLPKYCQLHSHSSEVFSAVITTCRDIGQLHSHSPLAHQSHCWPTGYYLNLPCQPTHYPINPTVGRPISPPIPLLADWLLLEFAMSADPLAHQSHCWLTGGHFNLPCRLTH